jgi:actin related protein 2/3 complex subunit 2
MLLLDYHNKIVEDTLIEKLTNPPEDGKYESVEITIADFDGVIFHIFSDQNSKNLLNVSVSIKCFRQLQALGVESVLKNAYGNYLVSSEQGFDATLQIDLAKPPSDVPKVAREFALLKRNCLAAAFYKAISDVEGKKGSDVIELKYRDEEAFYLKPESDRLIVIFSIQFKDADDVVVGKVFLQEYADARKTISNAPSVSFSQKEPPLELKNIRGLKADGSQGYVSFVLFAPHLTGTKKEKTVDNILTFRNYLHYHIKCSKAFLHTRMRNRVRAFLQVLNRAKSEPQSTEKRTITGKTFKRPDEKDSEIAPEYNI